MESEKVKEIKKALKDHSINKLKYQDGIKIKEIGFIDILTLINELENGNTRLQSDCADIAKDYQEMVKLYDEKCEECDLLKQQLDETWTFKTTQDGKCNILDIVRKVERKETVDKLINKLINYNEFLLHADANGHLFYVDFAAWLDEVAKDLKEN